MRTVGEARDARAAYFRSLKERFPGVSTRTKNALAALCVEDDSTLLDLEASVIRRLDNVGDVTLREIIGIKKLIKGE